MYVANVEAINKELFYCENEDVVKRLIKNGIMYISKKYKKDKTIWIFVKTDSLDKMLKDGGVVGCE